MKTRYGPGGIRNVPFAFLLYLARRNKLHRSRLRFPLPLDQLNLWSREEQSSLGGDSIALKCARGDAGGDDGGDVLVLGGVGGDD